MKKLLVKIKIHIETIIWCYIIPDKISLKKWYYLEMGKRLDYKNPSTLSEKIQWLKIHDRNPLYHKLVDKYEVKKIIGDLIGEEHIIKPLGIWNDFKDIDFSTLPNQFVLKFTHDSGSVTVCKDKRLLDYYECAKKYAHSFKNRDYYHRIYKEWAYKGVRPRILAEEYLKDDKYEDLTNYEFYCCNGTPKFVNASINKLSNDACAYLYSLSWERLHPELPNVIERPKNFDLMIELSKKIAKFINNPFERIDFYEVNGNVYFGEITFYPAGGVQKFFYKDDDAVFGRYVDLSKGAI